MQSPARRAIAQLTTDIDRLVIQRDRLRNKVGDKPRSDSPKAARWRDLDAEIYRLKRERELIERVPAMAPLAAAPSARGEVIARCDVELYAVGMPTYTALLAALTEAQACARDGRVDDGAAAVLRVKIIF